MLFLVFIIYMILAVYEFVPLYKEKQWSDFTVNGVLFFLSLITAILLSLGINIPSPVVPIQDLITSIFGK